MLTEKHLRENPLLIKAFMGLPAEVFWQLVTDMTHKLPAYELKRLDRENRQRAVGGGQAFDLPLVIRAALVLTYLRLHMPQQAVACLYKDATQSDVSRELRRLLPLMKQVLPCPEVWEMVEAGEALSETELLALEQLADGLVLIDATEQQVYRPGQSNEERLKYFSGKRKQFTRKTQFATTGQHDIRAISVSVPGAKSDIKLSDEVGTVGRLPDECEVQADKGYQGLDKRVGLVTIQDVATGEQKQVPRLIVKTPVKKPKGGALNEAQQAYNRAIGQVRVRIEHCIGWVKNWAIIATRFRCAHSIYTEVMQVVCGLVNLQTQRWQAAKSQAVG
jgi:DDE superfamily endonuclease